ncbi:hypothetical protein E4T39_03812 [Aureobasidium subglaciale]|nr:hypothetical protein E4T39_03812 [Aureobasidium subglaciale]
MPPPSLTPAQQAAIFADGSGLDLFHIHPGSPNGAHWVGGWKLGTGSYGQVSLWLLIDSATYAPLLPIAIKDTASNKPTTETGVYLGIYEKLVAKGMDMGIDPAHPLGQAPRTERFFKEAYIQGTMTEPNSAHEMFSVPLYGWARKQPSIYGDAYKHYRLYMPSYEYGDLTGIISGHLRKKRGIPEPFIWHTLQCLMKSAVQLEVQARKHRYPQDSDVIVVFDMKPDNILLAAPNRNSSFPIYPRPHIADLGGAFEAASGMCWIVQKISLTVLALGLTNNYDPPNLMHKMSFQRTQGYDAPEMTYEAPLGPEILRGTCTNIWQIGRVAEALMKLELVFEPIAYRDMDSLGDLEVNIKHWQGSLPGQNYSNELKVIVRGCLKFEPSARPTPDRCLNYIERKIAQHCHGMETYGSDDWFKDQRNKANVEDIGKPPPPIDPPETEATRREKQELDRRLTRATPWLRTWTLQEQELLCKLNVFPDEKFEVEYRPKNNFWTTDEDESIFEWNGVTCRHPLPYRMVSGVSRRVVSNQTVFANIGDLHVVSGTAQGGAPLP